MWRLSFKSPELGLVWLLVGVFASGQAHAQACCAGASALTPGRLELHEDAAVGIAFRAGDVMGSFDGARHYLPAPEGSTELDLEEDVLGSLRVLKNGQVSLLIPFVETDRQVPGLGEFGGGFGDINLSGRYDFFPAGGSTVWPGVALLLGVTFPTGRSPEDSTRPLATDATGIGAFQLNAGVALEQTFGRWLVNLTGLLAQRTTHRARGIAETLGTQLSGFAAFGYTFPSDLALAASLSYTHEGDAALNGAVAPSTARSQTAVGGSFGYPLGESWRLQGSVFWNLPGQGLGQNQSAGPGGTLTLLRTWT